MIMNDSDSYMRIKTAAEYLGISERQLSLWMNSHRIPYRKVSRRIVLFKRSELDKALASTMIAVKGGKKGGAV
jgi:excisionase family DNA binding protein